MPSNTRTLADIKGEEKTLRDRVARLVDDQRSLSIKIDVDGDDDGLQERLGTVERGIDKASTQLATLGEEHRAEIRRMADAFGYRVTELRRVRIVNIKLGALKIGQWRNLTDAELLAAGASPQDLANPDYVRRAPVLE